MTDIKLTIKTLVLLPMWPLIGIALLIAPYEPADWTTCGGRARLMLNWRNR